MSVNFLAGAILLVIGVAVFCVGVFAFVDALRQRPDAYTATGKLTKPVWLAILGAALALQWLIGGAFGPAIVAAAAGIYLVDVRPKLLEIQGKSR